MLYTLEEKLQFCCQPSLDLYFQVIQQLASDQG
jgi:hypothetical protein